MDREPKVRAAIHALFRRGELSFLLHDTQKSMREMIMETDADEVLILSSRQLGKSFYAVCLAIECAIKNPKCVVRIFSPTLDQCNDIINDNMRIIEELAPPGLIKRMKSEKRWQIGSSEIRLGPLSNAHADSRRGGNCKLAILEECGFVSSDELKNALGSVINPMLLRSGGKLLFVTTPPKDSNHYLITDILPKCEAADSLARFTIHDNPQLTADQVEKAKARCVSDEEWRREYLAEVVKDLQSTVTPEFDRTLHVTSELSVPKYTQWISGIDLGGTVDKHALILCYWDFEHHRLCVIDERLLEKNTPTVKIIQEALEMEKRVEESGSNWIGSRLRVTDAHGQTLIDLGSEGFHVFSPTKGKGSWEAGISALRTALAKEQILIHERCKHLIACLNHAQFTVNRKDFKRTEALGHADMIMALCYAWRSKNESNPFPRHVGKHRERHHTRAPGGESNSNLAKIFLNK